jgi:predicted phosphodiesterase
MKKLIIPALLTFFISCSKLDRIEPSKVETNIDTDTVTFAEIGDYGSAGMPEFYVAQLVKSWNPDFIVSVGDNNYDNGKLLTIKNNITQFYGDYIYNFDAPDKYKCNGKAFQDMINRFFTTPGNHDSNNPDDLTPYYNFFTLPGNESYYSFKWGPVTFFSINSAMENLDKQKLWLETESKKASTPFKIVFFHHPPYSSGDHGNNKAMQWAFHNMGIDVVLTGHDHIYNRIEKNDEQGLIYLVNGLGGRAVSACNSHPLNPGLFQSKCFSGEYGAIRGRANNRELTLEFLTIDSNAVDIVTIRK